MQCTPSKKPKTLLSAEHNGQSSGQQDESQCPVREDELNSELQTQATEPPENVRSGETNVARGNKGIFAAIKRVNQ